MEINTLQQVTTEINGRKLDVTLEQYLPRYVVELDGLLEAVRDASRNFPEDLAPAAVFSVAPQPSIDK